jgi:hypothetical protein
MTATALLSELQNQGVILEPRGDRLAFGPKEKVTPELRERIVKYKTDLLRLLQPDRSLADAYRRYWTLPETELMEAFKSVYGEIVKLEAQAAPEVAWRTLRETAKAFHAETRTCPFCRKAGELHLPAEQPELELRHG